MRFHTGVLEAPRRRATSFQREAAVLLQQREDVPVEIVEGGGHSRDLSPLEDDLTFKLRILK
jgi:hypothetical protein